MSLNVLIIPEDFRKDQYILKPIVERMVAAVGHRARVRVCQDPLLGGVTEALRWERLAEIIDRYRGMTRVFLLLVDRDGVEGRRARLNDLEQQARDRLAEGAHVFLAEHAWQELEVWVLAGMQNLPGKWKWARIRADRDPKQRYFDAYAKARGLTGAPYGGREVLAKEAARNYPRIRQLCPEDVANLERRLVEALEA